MPNDDFIPTRRSLLSRLKNWDDTASWKDFFDTYGKMIYAVARRAGLSDAEAQDVIQETIVSVAKRMPGFHYDRSLGSFKSWLLTITRRRIADHFRKKHYEKNGRFLPREETLHTELLEEQAAATTIDLAEAWDEEWRKNLLEQATANVKRQVSPAQYQLFHLHVVKEMPAREVARRLGVKLTEVYLAKYKVAGLVKRAVKNLEKQNL